MNLLKRPQKYTESSVYQFKDLMEFLFMKIFLKDLTSTNNKFITFLKNGLVMLQQN